MKHVAFNVVNHAGRVAYDDSGGAKATVDRTSFKNPITYGHVTITRPLSLSLSQPLWPMHKYISHTSTRTPCRILRACDARWMAYCSPVVAVLIKSADCNTAFGRAITDHATPPANRIGNTVPTGRPKDRQSPVRIRRGIFP